jgi:hypothetical protein
MSTSRIFAVAAITAAALIMAGVQAIAGEPVVPEASTIGLGESAVAAAPASR